MNEEITQSIWNCPSCKAINDKQNTFCKNCGYDSVVHPENKKSHVLLIVSIIVILILTAAGVYFGIAQYKKQQETKQTKAYLQSQQVTFGDTVKAMNSLNSEVDFAKKYQDEKNLDLIVQKIGDEKYNSSKTVDTIFNAKKAQEAAKSTQTTEGLKFLIASFYQDAELLARKYDGFVIFKYDDAKINSKIEEDQKKFDQKFNTDFKSDDDLVAYFNGISALIDSMVGSYEGLTVPAGMEDYKKPIVALKDVSAKIKEFTDAVKKKDFKKADLLITEVKSSSQVMGTAIDKANGISANYYSQLHDEFVSLRGKADKIKTEIVLLDSKMEIQPLDFSIEGW